MTRFDVRMSIDEQFPRVQEIPARVSDAAAKLSSEAQKAASNVSERVQHAGERVSEMATSAKSGMGERLTGLASSVRESEPWVVEKAERAADGLDRAGSYIKDASFKDFADDVAGLARSHPVPVILLAFGAGFFLARRAAMA